MALLDQLRFAGSIARVGAEALFYDRIRSAFDIGAPAGYHGALWEDPRLGREWTPLLDSESWQRNFNVKTGFDVGAAAEFRFAPDEIPRVLHDRKGEVRAALMRSLEINARGPRTPLHQDVHPGNWFRLPDGTLHLFDWQGGS